MIQSQCTLRNSFGHTCNRSITEIEMHGQQPPGNKDQVTAAIDQAYECHTGYRNRYQRDGIRFDGK